MATGERIRFFRTLRGMTQKYLGLLLGFPESSADVRLAQYESEDRTPKAELTGQMAEALDVSPKAIAVPDIDTMDGLMHTLFALEDRKLLRITNTDGLICLRAEIFDGGIHAADLEQRLRAWQEQSARLPVRSPKRHTTAGGTTTPITTTRASMPQSRPKYPPRANAAGSQSRKPERMDMKKALRLWKISSTAKGFEIGCFHRG